MKAILVEQIGAFRLVKLPKPQPGNGEVLIETAVTGLCRTDLKIIEVGHRDLVLPRIPGEEIVGTIRAVGPEVADDNIGKRVYVYPGTSCGACRPCLQGAGNLCRHMKIMGFHRDGGFAEYVLAPLASTIAIPEGCPFDHAVMAEPLSCCLNALELAALKSGERIGIWGGGPAGAFLSRAAAAMEAHPIVIEPHPGRHSYHAPALADPGDQRFDVAVVAVGSARAYHQAMAHLDPRGRLVLFSGLARDEALQAIDFNAIHYEEQTIVGAYGCSYRHGVTALTWIHQGRVGVADLITHQLPLADLGRALDLVRERAGMKILLYP